MTTRMIPALVRLACLGCAHMPEVYSVGCVTLDLATTQIGLSQGYTERNGIYPDDYSVLTGALVAAGVHYGLRRWDKTAAWYGYGSARCAAGLYNLEVMR